LGDGPKDGRNRRGGAAGGLAIAIRGCSLEPEQAPEPTLTALPALPHSSAADRPRAVGEVRLASKALGPVSALADLRQAGAMKALFPAGTPDRLTAMVLNTAGGITGGDRFRLDARAGAGSRLTVTTQAAERIYAALPGETGVVVNRLELEAGARLDWLPQETIVFDKARLKRSLTVEMAGDAVLLAVEPVVFGRRAMGERVTALDLVDRLRLNREGVPLYADALRLAGDATAILAGTATGGGAGAAATVLYAGADAEAFRDPVRGLLPEAGGASLARPGLLVVRLLAGDSFDLRLSLIPILTLLNGSALPRSWML
jgi:urease accessory protein